MSKNVGKKRERHGAAVARGRGKGKAGGTWVCGSALVGGTHSIVAWLAKDDKFQLNACKIRLAERT